MKKLLIILMMFAVLRSATAATAISSLPVTAPQSTNKVALFGGPPGGMTNFAATVQQLLNSAAPSLLSSTNQPGYSNYISGLQLTISNSFQAPTNTSQEAGIKFVGNAFMTGTGGTNVYPVMEQVWKPTIQAGSSGAAGTMVWQSRTNENGAPTTNMTLNSLGALGLSGVASGINAGLFGVITGFRFVATSSTDGYQIANSGTLFWGTRATLYSPADGVVQIRNNLAGIGNALIIGDSTAAAPGLGATNGDFVLFGGNRLFAGGSTNRLLVHGGVAIGHPGISSVVTITNILAASATLDFPSTAAGAVSDLPITVTGCSDGDVVHLGVPSAQITGLTGSYYAWSSNGIVYVRFANNNLVAAQDPASGLFKVVVTKF